MFSNTLINHSMIGNMSHKNGSILSKKKVTKQSKNSSFNYIDKLIKKNLPNTGLSRLEGLPEILESNSPNNSKNELNDIMPRNESVESYNSNENYKKFIKDVSSTFTSKVENTNGEETELIGILTRQLYLATNQIQRMQSAILSTEEQLKLKEKEIVTLKHEREDFQVKNKIQESNRRKQNAKTELLSRKCQTLEKRIFEMEKFLSDYGLVWIGESNNKALDPLDSSSDYIDSCYSQLLRNIEELNFVAGKDEIQVQRKEDGAGAMFKTPKCISLKFYKNGLIVEGGRLRSYSDSLTKCFIRDILDGYFPSEFQNNYPNGVPLKVEDHRIVSYVGSGADFPGCGYRLGKRNPHQISKEASIKKSANSWPGSTSQSPTNTNRDRDLTTLIRDSSHKCVKKTIKTDSLTSIDLGELKCKILASHNNNCSDSHLQSHINAELSLSNRRTRTREAATKHNECCLSINDDCQKRLGRRETKSRQSINEVDRLTSGLSARVSRFRSRSLSLSKKSFTRESSPKISSLTVGNSVLPNWLGRRQDSSLTRKPKAVNCSSFRNERGLPMLLQINDSTGESGELRLKIRSPSGGTVFLVHVSAEDTVARLYQILNDTIERSQLDLKKYHIVTNGYESKKLDSFQTTLKEYGIMRDSVLHLVNG